MSAAASSGASAFAARHVGTSGEQQAMLRALGYPDADALVRAALPAGILTERAAALPEPASEAGVLAELRRIASRNRVTHSMLGQGYYGTVTPAVIRRNVLENPSWYTAYTPYQSEISQGRLEALLVFQTMCASLTGLPVANASLLDEATAAAEAMLLAHRAARGRGRVFAVDRCALAQTRAVLSTRAAALDIELADFDPSDPSTLPDACFGVLVQYPAADGRIVDLAPIVAAAHERRALAVVAADILALALLPSPGEAGADVAVGSTQRFGVPMGAGGPHAAYMAVRERLVRQLPGRLVGVTRDAAGEPALRLALQTREQHIRRERATSNICTAQVLLAVLAACYAVWHGPEGIRRIATRVARYAAALGDAIEAGGLALDHTRFFDTLSVRVASADDVVEAARARDIDLWRADRHTVRLSVDETTTPRLLRDVAAVFGAADRLRLPADACHSAASSSGVGRVGKLRSTPYLTERPFCRIHSETQMMRWLRSLAARDYALDRGMIPLGSCTLKLNGAALMEPISWPQFADIHPFAPAADTAGYRRIVRDLTRWLADITGYDAVTLQPNAGSQGELTGLLAIRRYHRARGEGRRRICLIPQSAHGTNAASATLAGFRVVVVGCDEQGSVDVEDLRRAVQRAGDELGALMVTYPSTHGAFEPRIREVCDIVHRGGGQVYMDGANLNALLGYARFGEFGGDVSHLNLHKTFAIPHGGGGPGVGPVAAKAHLAPFLPGGAQGGPVAAAPWGSAGILPISWAYLRAMGRAGLLAATRGAVLAANYVAARLSDSYPILYRGPHGLVAHECILDLRPLTERTGISAEDVCKRLIDYGFHAPTMSFPVHGTLMVEPTESEDLGELDRFVAAMRSIRREADRVGSGEWPAHDNPLVNAPHTAASLAGAWTHPYSRAVAAYPFARLGEQSDEDAGGGPAPGRDPGARAGRAGDARPTRETGDAAAAGERAVERLEAIRDKYWPPVSRVNDAYGDRHVLCVCPPPDYYAHAGERG